MIRVSTVAFCLGFLVSAPGLADASLPGGGGGGGFGVEADFELEDSDDKNPRDANAREISRDPAATRAHPVEHSLDPLSAASRSSSPRAPPRFQR